MARHRPHHLGGGSRGGGGGGSNHNPNANHAHIRCPHCDISKPRPRFPKSALKLYDKKVARGDDPATIKTICWDCINNPDKSSTLVDARPQTPAQPVPRGRCADCLVEYPLTTKYFLKVDIRIDKEGSRSCFSCRKKQVEDRDELVHSPVGFGSPEDNDPVLPDGEQEDDELFHTKFEDLATEKRDEIEAAGNQYGNLLAKLVNTSAFERRRRARPSIEMVIERQRQAYLELANRFRQGSWEQYDEYKTSLVTSSREDIHPDMIRDYENLFLPTIHALTQARSRHNTPVIKRSGSTSSEAEDDDNEWIDDDSDNESDSDENDPDAARLRALLELRRLPEPQRHEREELYRHLERTRMRFGSAEERERQRTKQLAQENANALAERLQSSLNLTENNFSLHPRYQHRQWTIARNATAAFEALQRSRSNGVIEGSSSTAISPASLSTLTLTPSTPGESSIRFAASGSGAATLNISSRPGSSTPIASSSHFTSDPIAAAASPAKKPRIVRETPVDPRRAMIEERCRLLRQEQEARGQVKQEPTQKP